MSKLTPIYNFLYLEDGDIIYPGYDQDNMTTAENQIFGMYDYLGQGIISGWTIHWMGCTSDAYVLQQRQALLDAYRTDPFSYYALQYQSLDYPVTEDDWSQCIVVSTGLGIVGVYHAATEYPSFFRFTTANHFYVWAEKNVCTNTEYLCSIVAPQYPDEDYDLTNPAIYIGEVFTNTVNSNVTITQIIYSERRRELKNAQGDIQRILKQALVNHVHSGEGDMPSKINLSTNLTINVTITEFSNVFTITYPSGFQASNYSIPQVYLNSTLLLPSQYQISGNLIYLQNSVPLSSTLQIVYQIAPGPNIYITASLTPPRTARTLNFDTVYYLTNGSTRTLNEEQQEFVVWSWSDEQYSKIQVYLNSQILDPTTYNLYQVSNSSNNGGRLQFVGPILPSISNFSELDIIVKFTTPSFQVEGELSSDRIKSINASTFTRGTVPISRISGLSHLGLLRVDDPAILIPYKKLLDSGDHIRFYPEIDSLIQHSDYINFASVVKYIKSDGAESNPPPRIVASTPNGLYATTNSPINFENIFQMPWNTDNGVANVFAENYFGNFIVYKLPNFDTQSLNPKNFWVLSKSKNQFTNILYISTDFGITYSKVNLPFTSANEIVTINDFIYTVEVFQYTVGEVILTPKLDVRYLYYMACDDGLYTSTLSKNQNKTRPIWTTPSKNTTNASTGSINKISEAVNIGTITTTYTGGLTERNYVNYRNIYAACDSGLFVFSGTNGTKFTTSSTNYNVGGSAFNFSAWLGIEDSSNTIFGVVWGDNYGIYYSNSGQQITTVTTSSNSSTTTVTYNQPLTLSRTNLVTVACATNEPIILSDTINSVDGYGLSDGDLVLVKNQSQSSENGIYIWSVASQTLLKQSTGSNKVYVTGGNQAETEWIELDPSQNNTAERNYALWFANLVELESDDYIVAATVDDSGKAGYYHSFFVATTKYIYRILNFPTPNFYPVVERINWDYENNGLITNIQHFGIFDPENGLLVVFTENGIFKSTPAAFVYGPVDALNQLILPNDSYVRFINTFTTAQAAEASVYDDFTFEEYTGKILSIGLTTTITSLPDGQYLNQRVNASGATGFGLTVDLTVKNNLISDLNINNPGSGYEDDILELFTNVSNLEIVKLQNAITQGIFQANAASQYFLFSKPEGVNPSRLLYEVDYKTFYTRPWNNYPLVLVKVNNSITDYTFGYNAESGQINFITSLPKQYKNSVTVTLTNQGQYISNVGTTPHGEVFNVTIADAAPAAGISSTYDPITAPNNLLFLNKIDNTKWNSNISVIKVTGQRAPTSSAQTQPYTEIIQVGVSTANGLAVYIKSKPTTLPLTIGSNVYVARPYSNVLGIEDKITLSKTKLTYHMDSVSHANVYNLSNGLLNLIPNLYEYPTYPNEILEGVNRGLQNTIALNSLTQFDPTATFIGYTFGVDPSSSDVAAAPSTINLILDFTYGNNPTFATDKGIWQYIRSNQTWIRVDTLDNSELVYFANQTLTNSLNQVNTYAGTNQGLYFQYEGQYTQNPLFTEPLLSISMGSWYTESNKFRKRYEAYGKNDSLSFVLRTENLTTGEINFASDYFDGYNIYSIYYNTFNRYDDKGNKTEHPAIYLATDYSVWAFTTDAKSGSPSDRGPGHTLLVGREMFGNNIIRNPNLLNPGSLGLPAKIFTIIEVPSGGRATWLAFGTSNGVYVVINWKQCDVGDPAGLNFFPQNANSNNAKGRQCYKIIPKTSGNENSIYFLATDSGVYKSINRCFDWSPTAKFNGQELSVSDITYFTNSGTGYLIATTNIGLWISDDDGDTWTKLSEYNDANLQVLTNPTYGIALDETPVQTFSAISSGTISKAFVYFNPENLTGITTLYASISNGTATTQSQSYITLGSSSYPGMYGFAFTNTPYLANTTYSLGILTGNSAFATQITWGLSNLDNPFAGGTATTSGGAITNKDFFFRINLNTPATPIETIEPVGFYNTSYPVGFSQGKWSGASISSTGYLFSNVGIICNVVLDVSKSFEINDTAIITQSGVSTSYLREAVINSLVPNGIDTNCLSTRLQNGLGTSKFIASVYGFNNKINDLLFFSTAETSSSSNCLNTSAQVYQGYTNNTSVIQNSIDYVSNTGRLSKLYDAVQYNARLQFPAVINGYYAQNLSEVDANFLNINAVKVEYKSDFELYLNLNLTLQSGSTYNIIYEDNSNNFVWVDGTYEYSLVIYQDGTSSTTSFTLNPSLGTLVNTYGSTPVYLLLSKNWSFDTSINDLSSNTSAWELSPEAVNFALTQYSYSFKPLIIVTSDGNDNSQATALGVNSSLKVAWTGTGTQVLVVEPSQSGNENDLRVMIENTDSKLFKYTTYPENQLKNVLFEEDSLNLFTSEWFRNFDYDSPTFISYIFASTSTPGNSLATVSFSWSADRINFSNFITLDSDTRYYLNQKVLSIYYKVNFIEDYASNQRVLPAVTKLYHVVITPALQTYLSYPQSVTGQVFETLANASFTNSDLVNITPIVGRTSSTDTSYYNQVQLNRNSALPNLQTSYRIIPAVTVSGLKLLPLVNDITNLGYYVVDSSGNLYTWTIDDTFKLFVSGNQIPPSPPGNSYTTVPESGIVYINANLYNLIDGVYVYESYSVTIDYIERRESIIGQPTITYDLKTYYFRNGRVPTDSQVVILVNQEIYKGNYVISAYDGTVTFAKTLNSTDYVTAFVKFADEFRAGLQIETYSPNPLSLQSYNFTYTSIPDLPTYTESYNYAKPILIGSPLLSPSFPNLDQQLTLSYNYFDDSAAPENNSEITWWRQRTGIEYVTFNPSYSLTVSGANLSGINTVSVKSFFNQDSAPFILSVTVNSTGIATNIISVLISDRGAGFIGTGTNLELTSVLSLANGGGNVVFSNLGVAMTAYTLTQSYTPGYATTSGFVRINPSNSIGYANTVYGFGGSPSFTSFPDYDGRLFEQSSDIATRTLFDARDLIYVQVTPSNGINLGNLYQSNTVTLSSYYTPVITNPTILGSISTYNGISTTLTVNNGQDQVGIYSYFYPANPFTQNNHISWYKLSTNNPILISSVAILSSSLITINDQIYFTAFPGVIRADGSRGIGQTVSSDVFTVI